MKFFLRAWDWPHNMEQAARDLTNGAHRHDVIETCLRLIEEDESVDCAGFGGFPNVLGTMQLDAGFMDGNSRIAGAVAGMEAFLPLAVARRLMEERFHVLLTGAGAEIFAHEHGMPPRSALSSRQKEMWAKTVKPLLEHRGSKTLMEIVRKVSGTINQKDFDTVVMIASDGNGLSVGGSTSGWPYSHPGRTGDAPVCGAGFYADSRYGACFCTYTGEMALRQRTAGYVVEKLEIGKSVEEAVGLAIKDLSGLHEGKLGTLVIHAMDAAGNDCVKAVNPDCEIPYMYWRESMTAPERRTASPVNVPGFRLD